jgi:hypothetical protein
MRYHGLLDSPTMALLALTDNVAALMFAVEHSPDTTFELAVDAPHYRASFFGLRKFFLARVEPKRYPEWKWNVKLRTFSRTDPRLVTDTLRNRAELARRKMSAIDFVTRRLSAVQGTLRTGVTLQETVYTAKRLQAQRLKDKGYTPDSPTDYLFVVQYADFANISLKQAADDILFKAKLDDEKLAQSELVRLTYFKKIGEAKTCEEVASARASFMSDYYHTA